MTEQISGSEEGLMKLARMILDRGGDHRARFDAVLERLTEFMLDAGYSDECVETQAKILTNCYCSILWEAKVKEVYEEPPKLH